MARKPSERRHSEEDIPELNLAPFMAILVILIPMLIYAFSFYEVRVQAVSAPRMGTAKKTESSEEKDKKPLNLTVLVTEKGFVVKQQAGLETEGKKPISRLDGGQYDYASLYNRLMQKKDEYPDETTVNIGAEMDVPWYIIARTIDACRVQLEEDSYQSLDEFAEAPPRENSDGDTMDLFPAVVFVVAE